MWRPPTPPSLREQAVRAYITGEVLCDAGKVAQGIASFKAASSLAWELDGEVWPAWARELHALLLSGDPVETAAPMLVGDDVRALHPPLAALRGACPTLATREWWRSPDAVAAVATSLRRRHFAVVDGFAGASAAVRLRGACKAASLHLRPAADRSRTDARSDQVCWDPDGFGELSARTDALVRLLRAADCPALAAVVGRQKPMLSRYAAGDFFRRHVDNDCAPVLHLSPSKGRPSALCARGPRCSPRVLTAVYYLQQAGAWDASADGGCLRLYGPQCATADSSEEDEEEEAAVGVGRRRYADAQADIAPVADRLVLFLADQRCPHEVLPILRPATQRFALTIWYTDASPVPEFWATSGTHDGTLVPLDGEGGRHVTCPAI